MTKKAQISRPLPQIKTLSSMAKTLLKLNKIMILHLHKAKSKTKINYLVKLLIIIMKTQNSNNNKILI